MVKEKNRIILFSPQPVVTGRRVLPISLLSISSLLAQENGKYVIQIFHSYDSDEYLEAIKNLDDVICVGISSMTGYQIIDGLRFAKMVRERNKNMPIIWGGIHPTIMPIKTVKNYYVDIIVKGQGEITFYELVKCLQSNGELKNIPGIVFKTASEIIENRDRPIMDINNFPKLPYHLLGDKIERYIKPTINPLYSKRSLPIITSDGCPFNCGFCFLASPQFRRKYVGYSVERVLDEIEFLIREYNIDGLCIRDTNFFIDTDRVRAILEGLIQRNLKIALTEVNVRIDQLLRLDDDFWKLMEMAGVKDFLIGIESGDQEMLNLINKKITVDQIRECEKKLIKYKINVINSFITAFPTKLCGSAREHKKRLNKELYNTINFIDEIYEVNPLSTNMIFIYTPYPGTPLYKLCLESGFQEPESLEEWGALNLTQKYFPWVTTSHINKVAYFEKLFLIKKLTSGPYIKTQIARGNNKYKLLYYLGILRSLNLIASLRIKFKIILFPFEKYLLK